MNIKGGRRIKNAMSTCKHDRVRSSIQYLPIGRPGLLADHALSKQGSPVSPLLV